MTSVDKLEVAANNTTAAAITQTGSGDILNLYDGSTEVFTVTDGGNVGINSSIPAARLDVYKDFIGVGAGTYAGRVYGTDSGVNETGVRFVTKGTGDLHNASDAYLVHGISNGTTRFVFGANGNVGISSALPEQRLTVSGATDITHYNNSTINNDRLQLGFNAPEGYLKTKNSSGSPASNLAFYTTDSSGNTNKRMHLSYDGKVGINTTTLTEQLEVDGDIRVRNQVKFRDPNGDETGAIGLNDDDNFTIQSFGTDGHITLDTGYSRKSSYNF